MAQVVIEHLTKIFRGPQGERICAVDDASLEVADRESLVLVGPSGCGKTTTLRLIAGLEEPTRGTIFIDGRSVNEVPPKDRDVAMVFQHYAIYPHLSAYENMAFGLKLRRYPRAEIENRVREAAEMLDLTVVLARRPQDLSGGQRQRVALGRALVRRPKVFLFDEPLSNLDPPLRLQMRTELARLQARLGATMLFVTHDQVEALMLGHRVAVMRSGVIQQVAEPMELYQQPANRFVAGFIGSPPMNFFNGALARKGNALFFQEQTTDGAAGPNCLAVRLDDGMASRMNGYLGKPVVLGIRPENISHKVDAGEPPPERTVEAVVELVEPVGSETYLHLAGGAHGFIARVQAGDRVSVKDKIPLLFDMRHAHFFNPATEKAIL